MGLCTDLPGNNQCWALRFGTNFERVEQPCGEHHVSILPALALINSNDHSLAVNVSALQTYGFGNT